METGPLYDNENYALPYDNSIDVDRARPRSTHTTVSNSYGNSPMFISDYNSLGYNMSGAQGYPAESSWLTAQANWNEYTPTEATTHSSVNGNYLDNYAYNSEALYTNIHHVNPTIHHQQQQQQQQQQQGRDQANLAPPFSGLSANPYPTNYQSNGFDVESAAMSANMHYAPTHSNSAYLAPSHPNAPSLRVPQMFTLGEQQNTLGNTSTNLVSSELTDVQARLKPRIEEYLSAPNRVLYGERSLIIMTSKVAQKSYKAEKRFFCPPPACILIGNAWWSAPVQHTAVSEISPPSMFISIEGEAPPTEDSALDWSAASGQAFEATNPIKNTTFIGRSIGRQLFISDENENKKHVEAIVKMVAPAVMGETEHVMGLFRSRPIKVISKPSKKKQSPKNFDLCINHGSTVALFHRLRSQSMSTKYLGVSGNIPFLKGSDGKPLDGSHEHGRFSEPAFVARTSSWDCFMIFVVDVTKPLSNVTPTDPVFPPSNAIPFPTDGSSIPLFYNQTVVLQCILSGIISPIMVIRRVDISSSAVGGGAEPNYPSPYCAPGEVCGDRVSQLHKVAFEQFEGLLDPLNHPGTPGFSNPFFSCSTDQVQMLKPAKDRQWKPMQVSEATSSPMPKPSPLAGSVALPNLPPLLSSSASVDFFGVPVPMRESPSPPPPLFEFLNSHDGGRVKRAKRSMSISSGLAPAAASRKRGNSESSGHVRSRRNSSAAEAPASAGVMWHVDVGETSVWTIVGTEQIRYDFFVPPKKAEEQRSSLGYSFLTLSEPVTPFPRVCKYLPPGRASEQVHHSGPFFQIQRQNSTNAVEKQITIYGENFDGANPPEVFFGTEPSPYVEVRCQEVIGCIPPHNSSHSNLITLARSDGVIYPTSVIYQSP